MLFPLTSWWFINNNDNDSIPNWTFSPRFPHIHIHILACMMCVVLWSSALSQWHHIRPSIAANGSNDDSQIPMILHSHPPQSAFSRVVRRSSIRIWKRFFFIFSLSLKMSIDRLINRSVVVSCVVLYRSFSLSRWVGKTKLFFLINKMVGISLG